MNSAVRFFSLSLFLSLSLSLSRSRSLSHTQAHSTSFNLVAGSSGRHVENPDEMETLSMTWPPGLSMPTITAPTCLQAVSAELAVLAPTCQFDPRNQHKARFKSLLEQKKNQSVASAPANIIC